MIRKRETKMLLRLTIILSKRINKMKKGIKILIDRSRFKRKRDMMLLRLLIKKNRDLQNLNAQLARQVKEGES